MAILAALGAIIVASLALNEPDFVAHPCKAQIRKIITCLYIEDIYHPKDVNTFIKFRKEFIQIDPEPKKHSYLHVSELQWLVIAPYLELTLLLRWCEIIYVGRRCAFVDNPPNHFNLSCKLATGPTINKVGA